MRPFVINGQLWRPVMVMPDDERLVDRTGRFCLATTDPQSHTVYLSKGLHGKKLLTVMTHEATHCAMHSYGMLDRLHDMIPESSWVDMEEWSCNLVADYGAEIIEAARTALSAPIPAKGLS